MILFFEKCLLKLFIFHKYIKIRVVLLSLLIFILIPKDTAYNIYIVSWLGMGGVLDAVEVILDLGNIATGIAE